MSKYEIKDPDAPMTFKQGIMIRNLGGGDVRPENLTKKQASDRISELLASRDARSSTNSKSSERDFEELYALANEAGRMAGNGHLPRPMTIIERTNPFDGYSPIVNQWHESEGLCGFAWVNIKPGTSQFARWLKKMNYARTDSYYGGVTIWISDYNQSVERKEAHARAMAKVFSDAGIKAYAASRLD